MRVGFADQDETLDSLGVDPQFSFRFSRHCILWRTLDRTHSRMFSIVPTAIGAT